MPKLKIAVIVGTTRDSRFGIHPAQWIFEQARLRDDLDVELVDIKSFDLPLFNEVASNAWAPSQDPKAVAWQKKVGEFDGYIFVTAEYNHSISGALKNALDQAYTEWNRKAAAIVGYGSVGGARAAEHLRGILVELQIAPTRAGVNIGGSEFFKVHPHFGKQPISSLDEVLAPSVKALLDDLTWWTAALKAAREKKA